MGWRKKYDVYKRISVNGDLCWYFGEKLHRENGPAFISKEGEKHWYLFGERHRENGPAVECATFKYEEWYNRGKLHRIGGPAVESASRIKWYLYGSELSLDDYMNRLQMSPEEKVMFKLKWGG